MRLPLLIEPDHGTMDGTIEVVGIREGAVGEVVPLEITPAAFDRIQLRCILGQPLDREPRPLGEGLSCALARMDWTVIHDNDQRLGTLVLAIGPAKVIKQVDKIDRVLGRAGPYEKLSPDRVVSAEHRTPFSLARCLDAQVRTALGPTVRQVGVGAGLGFVEEEQVDGTRYGLLLQRGQPAATGGDGFGLLAAFQRVAWPAPAIVLRRSWTESQASPIAGPPRRSISARSRGKVQPRS